MVTLSKIIEGLEMADDIVDEIIKWLQKEMQSFTFVLQDN